MRYNKFYKENSWYGSKPLKSESKDDYDWSPKWKHRYSSSDTKRSTSRSKSVCSQRQRLSSIGSNSSRRSVGDSGIDSGRTSRARSVGPRRDSGADSGRSSRAQSLGPLRDSGIDPGRSIRSQSMGPQRRRTFSSSSHISLKSESDVHFFGSRRTISQSVCSQRSIRTTSSDVDYQLDKFSHDRASRYQRPMRNKYIENDYSYSTPCSSRRQNSDAGNKSGYESGIVVMEGIQLSDLYALWVRRRAEFLEARREGCLHLMYGPEDGFLCGLCFKKFRHVVQLQQHCEELLHYACITCGRFFNTYTALGQHCSAMNHTKD